MAINEGLAAGPERLLRENASLPEVEGFLSELYTSRENIYLPDRFSRINFLYRGIDDLQNAVRKSEDRPTYELMCARIVARILCLARGADNVSVASGLEMKYPLEGCAYCGQLPCVCPENRPTYVLHEVGGVQAEWSISQWQEHLEQLYGAKNAERGINHSLLRLGGEFGELISLEEEVHGLPVPEAKARYTLELSDTMAWTMSAASRLGVDLGRAVDKFYGSGCLRCRSVPCACLAPDFHRVNRADYAHILEARVS